MVRPLLLLFLAACAHAQPTVAVTIARPVATVESKIEDHTSERIAAAKADIAEAHWTAASRALLAIVCEGRTIHGQDDFARCPATSFVNVAEAWGLIGDLALKGRFELAETEWTAAQRVVVRWGGRLDGAQLELAEIAFSHAAQLSGAPKYTLTLATTRDRLRRYGPALDAYAKVLESSSTSGKQRKEALDGAVRCITHVDWDGDGENDTIIGFDRAEVRAVIGASQQRWVAELYTRAIDVFVDSGDCDAARAGARDFVGRFPQDANAIQLAASTRSCP